jgi:hypothetical protein
MAVVRRDGVMAASRGGAARERNTLGRLSGLLISTDPLIDLGAVASVVADRGLDRRRRLVEPLGGSLGVVEASVDGDDLPDVGAGDQTRASPGGTRAEDDAGMLVHLDPLGDVALDQRRAGMTLNARAPIEPLQCLTGVPRRDWSLRLLLHPPSVLHACTRVVARKAGSLRIVDISAARWHTRVAHKPIRRAESA